MSQQAMALAEKGMPWRRNVAWWIIGLEGVVITIVGIYILADPDSARSVVRQIIGWFLLVNACLAIAASLRADGQANPITPYRMLGAGIGLSVGLLVVLEPVSDFITDDAARVILAIGLLGHGLVGLVGAFATRASGGMRRGALIAGAVNVAFALLLFYNVRRDTLDPRWFGIVAIAGGVLVVGYAYMRYREAHPTVMADDVSPAVDTAVVEDVGSSAQTAPPLEIVPPASIDSIPMEPPPPMPSADGTVTEA